MNGYQITFFTQQDRRHGKQPLAEWLIALARELGLRGATLVSGTEGFGRDGRVHSAHFFELADQPLEVAMAVTEAQATQLFARLREEKVRLFYIKTAVEFGTLGDEDPSS